MATFVAMLRGINVGGRNRVAMPELRAVVESLGYSEVRTYVQSGNVIFSGSGRTTTVAGRLTAGLRDDLESTRPSSSGRAASWPTSGGRTRSSPTAGVLTTNRPPST